MSLEATLFQHSPTPIEAIKDQVFTDAGVQFFLKRDDLLRMGPGLTLCGNKWRKLKYNLQAAAQAGHQRLLTYGGAFSNHIAAVAGAGAAFGFETIGIIRGERPSGLNPTLRFAQSCGMEFHFVSRSAFQEKNSPVFQTDLKKAFGTYYDLPEGGTNPLAIKGCEELASETLNQCGPQPPHYWAVSVGTGGTAAGLIRRVPNDSEVLGFSALKGGFLKEMVREWLPATASLPRWRILTGYHFGGYARHQPALLQFINAFYQQQGIALDPIYTGKMVYGIYHLARTGFFPRGSRVLAIHTGGLQGIEGFNERFGGLLRVGL